MGRVIRRSSPASSLKPATALKAHHASAFGKAVRECRMKAGLSKDEIERCLRITILVQASLQMTALYLK